MRDAVRTCEAPCYPKYWRFYDQLPRDIQALADKSFSMLKRDPHHPSLRFKKVGRLWSARVGIHYRAVAVEEGADLVLTCTNDAIPSVSARFIPKSGNIAGSVNAFQDLAEI